MKIIGLRIFPGRNVYIHRPAASLMVALEDLAGRESREFSGFNKRLLTVLPGLREHGCAAGGPNGFVKRLQEGTYFSHILEHTILEMQGKLGLAGRYGKSMSCREPGVYEVVFECPCSALAEPLARKAMALLESLLAGDDYDVEQDLALLRTHLTEASLGPSTEALCQAARKRNISVQRIGQGSLIQLGTGKFARRLRATLTDACSCLGADIAGDKALTKEILAAAGITVPKGMLVGSAAQAVAAWHKLQCPVVVKPRDGNQGRGVSLNLNGREEIERAYSEAARIGPQVLVEEYLPGKHYRLLVVKGRVVAASERIPAHVVGNGRDSIARLIKNVNCDPLRGEGHAKPLTRIVCDSIAHAVLERQGYSLQTVPPAGIRVWLRDNANLSTGGTAVDVSDQVHEHLAEMIVRAVRLIGLNVAGVDLVAPSLAQAPGQGSAIIEINAAPGIRMHHFPAQGEARDAAGAIIESLFPPGVPSEIPLVAVTGTNGKTTTCRLLAHVLRQSYKAVGLTSTEGIYCNEKRLVEGDTTGPWSARVILGDPEVDVAVLEVARGGLLRQGLAYDLCDVAVLTNISEDHLGQDNVESLEDLLWVKSLVLESVRAEGYAVINADDSHSLSLLPRLSCRGILFSLNENNLAVRRFLGAGGRAVAMHGDSLCFFEGATCRPLLPVREIPISFDGRAGYNVANALAAAAALWGLGVPEEEIKSGLQSFLPDARHNPGRQNLLTVGQKSVLVDYAHNIAGLGALAALARTLGRGRLLGVIASPGDRTDTAILKLGKTAAQGFDLLFIKEDRELKGRPAGEVAQILRRGAVAGGMAATKVQVHLEEREALGAALAAAQTDDLIVLLYEDLDFSLALLKEFEQELALGQRPYVVAGLGN